MPNAIKQSAAVKEFLLAKSPISGDQRPIETAEMLVYWKNCLPSEKLDYAKGAVAMLNTAAYGAKDYVLDTATL